jgi:hypothetical protein
MKISRLLPAALFAALTLPAQPPDFTPPTPLIAAILHNDSAEVARLLDTGASPNEGKFLGSPPIFLAFFHQNQAILRALINHGADLKATDPGGSTTLMWASANETASTEIVSELLKRGVDPNTKNAAGDSALTWAERRGYTPVVELLKKNGASDTAMIKQSVEKAVALLQKSGPEFVKVSGCTSCHHQSLPQMSYGMARERGFQVNPEISLQQSKAVIAMFKPLKEIMLQGKENLPDPAISVSYALIGLAAEGYAADDTTAAMAHLVSLQQNPDGSFRALPGRPPIESSMFASTALSVRALQAYGSEQKEQVRRAAAWLRTAKPKTTEDRVMQMLGLVWATDKTADLRALAKALAAEQKSDGGWAQLPGLSTDAYATGQALVALQASEQIDATDPIYQRGVAFLLRTQNPDGSWFVRTRSMPFQPYKESGFPYGKDQWISAAGTSWAAMALSATAPKVQSRISRTIF